MEHSYQKIDYVMEREGLDKVCKYSIEKGKNDPENPHHFEKRDFAKKIKDNITDCIGNTPLVRMANIERVYGLECELCKLMRSLNAYSG